MLGQPPNLPSMESAAKVTVTGKVVSIIIAATMQPCGSAEWGCAGCSLAGSPIFELRHGVGPVSADFVAGKYSINQGDGTGFFSMWLAVRDTFNVPLLFAPTHNAFGD